MGVKVGIVRNTRITDSVSDVEEVSHVALTDILPVRNVQILSMNHQDEGYSIMVTMHRLISGIPTHATTIHSEAATHRHHLLQTVRSV